VTDQKKAELLFKQSGQSSIPEYEQRALAERTKSARLRVLRLAREAELGPKAGQTGGKTEKLRQHKSPKTSRRRASVQ
jgi:hypothetical protein